jgi:RimJ/RimL family protein N-acetyltransferase
VETKLPILQGRHIRLEPLDYHHVDGLVAAAAADPSLYRWTPVPQGHGDFTAYIEAAHADPSAGLSAAFATLDLHGTVIGSTRFLNMERWSWPQEHARHSNPFHDVCEIGATWLTRAAIRTAANTEAKFLMLQHAFEHWHMLRVSLQTDARNQQSRAAIERLGAKFEGTLRAQKIAVDKIARDSARYSILATEWPQVKLHLNQLLHRAEFVTGASRISAAKGGSVGL